MNFYAYLRLKRFGIAEDAVNYTDHDRRYHKGHFDPATMTCEMREAEAQGDLVDVLNAEEGEKALYWKKYWEEHPEELAAKRAREAAARAARVEANKRRAAEQRRKEQEASREKAAAKERPEWVGKAQAESPAKVVQDAAGNPVVSFPFPNAMPRKLKLGHDSKAKEALLWVKSVSANCAGKDVAFTNKILEFSGSRYTRFLYSLETRGEKKELACGWSLTHAQAKKEGVRSGLPSLPRTTNGITSAPNAYTTHAEVTSGRKNASIIPQGVVESKGENENFPEGVKEWAARTFRAKKAMIPYLPVIVANATNERHKTQEEMLAASSEKHNEKKRGSAWAGGIYEYDVRIRVPDEDGTPRTYKGRMILGEDADGRRFFYDIVDLDDGTGYQPYFARQMEARHAAEEAAREKRKE